MDGMIRGTAALASGRVLQWSGFLLLGYPFFVTPVIQVPLLPNVSIASSLNPFTTASGVFDTSLINLVCPISYCLLSSPFFTWNVLCALLYRLDIILYLAFGIPFMYLSFLFPSAFAFPYNPMSYLFLSLCFLYFSLSCT